MSARTPISHSLLLLLQFFANRVVAWKGRVGPVRGKQLKPSQHASLLAFNTLLLSSTLLRMRFDAYLRQLGLNIKAARTRRNLRQIDIEEKIGLSYRHYQEIEAGRINVSIKTLFQLASLFRVEIEELVRKD